MTIKSNEEWKKLLSPEAYHITREAGTEPPWTGALLNEKRIGTFHCICCNTPSLSPMQNMNLVVDGQFL